MDGNVDERLQSLIIFTLFFLNDSTSQLLEWWRLIPECVSAAICWL